MCNLAYLPLGLTPLFPFPSSHRGAPRLFGEGGQRAGIPVVGSQPHQPPLPTIADCAPSLSGGAPEGVVQAAGDGAGEAASTAQHRAGKRWLWARGLGPGRIGPRGSPGSSGSSPPGKAHCFLRAGDPAGSLPGGEDHREPGGAVQCLHHAAGLGGLQHASGKSGGWARTVLLPEKCCTVRA